MRRAEVYCRRFNTPSVPRDGDTYKEYRRLSIEFIEARNQRIGRFAALMDDVAHNGRTNA